MAVCWSVRIKICTLAVAAARDRVVYDPGDRRRSGGELHSHRQSSPAGQFCPRDQFHHPEWDNDKRIRFFLRIELPGQPDHECDSHRPSRHGEPCHFRIATGSLLEASANATSWTVGLPQTQDYVIEVNPINGQVVNYSLTVTVTSPLSATSTNIAFTPGRPPGLRRAPSNPDRW